MQTLTYTLPKLLSIVLGISVLFGATHAKDVSAFAIPAYSVKLSNNSKQSDNSITNLYKIHAEHHNHIDRQTLKSIITQINKQAPQADLKTMQCHRHGVAKKVSKKQKYSDSWHRLLPQIA